MELRPYQAEAVRRVVAELRRVRSTLLVMATGTGKTVVFSTLAEIAQRRVLVVAHRDELIDQASDKLQLITGVRPETEKGASRASGQRLLKGYCSTVVSSVQTLGKISRIQRYPRDFFGLIVIDEAHRAALKNSGYRTIVEYFDTAKVVGVTATPDRLDRERIVGPGRIFASVAYEYQIASAIADGYLVPVRQGFVQVEGLDFVHVDGDMVPVLREEQHLHRIVEPTIRLAGERRTIVFAASVNHAVQLAKVFNRYRPGSAISLNGKSQRDYRKTVIERFREGKFQFLVNCSLFTEGFDDAGVACVAIASNTKSRSKYAQMVGRGTRPAVALPNETTAEQRRALIAESSKPDLLVLDFIGSTKDLSLQISVADVIATNTDKLSVKVAQRIKERIEAGDTRAVHEIEPEARLEVEEEQRKRAKTRAKFRTEYRDPLHPENRLATPKQRELIRKLTGTEPSPDLTKKQAGYWIGRIQKQPGTASPRQRVELFRCGVDLRTIRKLSYARAEELLKERKS